MDLNKPGYLRLNQIIGDKEQNLPPLIPVSKTAWYDGIKHGFFPKPVKLGTRTSAWRTQDIKDLIENGPTGF